MKIFESNHEQHPQGLPVFCHHQRNESGINAPPDLLCNRLKKTTAQSV
jgi:hypothetical protein